jgi:hypothetical protein
MLEWFAGYAESLIDYNKYRSMVRLGYVIKSSDLDILKKKFFALYTEDLGRYLDKELGGDFEALVFNCLQASEQDYDSEFHTEEKAKEDAESLYKMGQGSWGTDEKVRTYYVYCIFNF